MMEIEVLFISNGSGKKHRFTCDYADRTVKDGYASISFENGRHVNGGNRKVLTAQYAEPVYVITYEPEVQ